VASAWRARRRQHPRLPGRRAGQGHPVRGYDLAANTRWVNVGTGDIEAIIGAARAYPLEGTKAGDLDKKLGYFEPNTHRMRYQHFRDLGMFIGSGAIEGGIKAIVVQRAKQSGMHWTTEGAADIIALRCQHASGRWDELWPATNTTPAQLRAAV